MSDRTKVLLAIVGASMFWATAGTAKILLRSFDPFTAAFFRFFVASVVILPFFLRERRQHKSSLLPLIPMAFLSTGNILFFYWGLRTTTANAAFVIYTTVPLVVALAAPKLIGEQVTPKKFAGIILGLVGALFIAILPVMEQGQLSSGDLGGNLFVLIAVLCWSGYTITSRSILTAKRATPISMTAISIFISTVVFAVFTATQWNPSYVSKLTGTNLIIIFQLGIFVTVATYLLLQWAIKHSSATTASLNQYLLPIFAVVFNIFFLGERLTLGFIVGSIVVFAGVFLATGERFLTEVKGWKK
ncbi:MAG: DMT family transporter [Patescibacteria group bacterium]